jgi:hypothetical protein
MAQLSGETTTQWVGGSLIAQCFLKGGISRPPTAWDFSPTVAI